MPGFLCSLLFPPYLCPFLPCGFFGAAVAHGIALLPCLDQSFHRVPVKDDGVLAGDLLTRPHHAAACKRFPAHSCKHIGTVRVGAEVRYAYHILFPVCMAGRYVYDTEPRGVLTVWIQRPEKGLYFAGADVPCRVIVAGIFGGYVHAFSFFLHFRLFYRMECFDFAGKDGLEEIQKIVLGRGGHEVLIDKIVVCPVK